MDEQNAAIIFGPQRRKTVCGVYELISTFVIPFLESIISTLAKSEISIF